MKYFRAIPNIEVSNITGSATLATNILTRTELLPSLLNNPALFYQYDIQDGDTPEVIAAKYYGDSYRYWLVMFGNQIFDPQWDFPLSNYNFTIYLNDKYSEVSNTCNNFIMVQPSNNYNQILAGNFISNEVVYQGSNLEFSTASSTVINWNQSTLTLLGSNVTGTFVPGVPIIGSQSGANYTLNYSTSVSPLEYTQQVVYQYQQIVTTVDSGTGTTSVNTYDVDEDTYNNIPLNTVLFEIAGNPPVTVTNGRNALSIFDYEMQTNEDKRTINIIDIKYAIPLENQLISLLK